MKNRFVILCLMALITNSLALNTPEISITNNGISCSTQLSPAFFEIYAGQDCDWTVTARDNNNNVLGSSTVDLTEVGNDYVNSISSSNANVPCGGVVFCDSILTYPNGDQATYSSNLTKTCSSTGLIGGASFFGNISIFNNNKTNITGNNFGTIPFGGGNISSNVTATKILRLSKDLFFKVAGLLILTVITINIKPTHLALVSLFFGITLMTNVFGVFTLPISLTMFILILIVVELYRRGRI